MPLRISGVALFLAIVLGFCLPVVAQSPSAQTASPSPWNFGIEGMDDWTLRLPLTMQNIIEGVVEVTSDGSSEFQVTRSLYGTLPAGQKLLFDKVSRIRMIGSSAEYLRNIIGGAPVVDVPWGPKYHLQVPGGRQLSSYPPPSSDARFLILLRQLHGDEWGFATQTFSDFFLLRDGKVFQHAFAAEGDKRLSVWLPIFPTVSEADFRTALQREIDKLPAR